MTLPPVLSVRDLTVGYRLGSGVQPVVHDASFDLGPGQVLALVGESGSGKSTLLHLLGGLDRPTEGAIYFGQNNICRLPADELAKFRNRELGFVWQIQSLLGEFTAAETGVVVGGAAVINFAYVSIAWEGGVAIGSAINASFPRACDCK